MDNKLVIRGNYLVEVRDKNGKVIDKAESSNLIVNDGLERVAKLINGVSSTDFSYIGIGTGSTSPTNSDTALEAEITKEQADDTGGSYEADYKAIFEKTFTFGSGESYAITEAGVFDGSGSASTMLDRFTFSAKNVDSDTDLYVKITITVARS